jgi:choline/glycine/proline betaine transport protein
MVITFFHWGLHPWAIYIVLGLSLAYFAFRRGLPLKPASALYPLIGDRVHGPIGHLIDILAVFGTLFGLAASLGLGASQINTGLNSVFGLGEGALPQVIIIAVITAIAVTSVMLGIHGGIRRLSVGTIVLAGLLALFAFIVGPTVMILQFLASSAGAYLQRLPELSLQMFAFSEDAGSSGWLGSWTLFYWGWWISWSPFVGMFIARISYGYTIRQFIAGMLFIPTGMSMVWFAIFGGTGLQYVLNDQGGGLTEAGTTGALFVLMNQLPIGGIVAAIASLLGVLVVALFFATSSDSGSLVVDILTNGGDPNPKWQQRMFWAITEGVIAAILLVAGWAVADSASAALQPLQTAAVTSGLPFAVVLIFMCWGLLKGLSEDRGPEMAPEPTPEPGRAASRPRGAASPQQASALDEQERGQGRS